MEKNTSLSRERLDQLISVASSALDARNAIESCVDPEWFVRHEVASAAFKAVSAERVRLWKSARWGSWMNAHDKALATITGEL